MSERDAGVAREFRREEERDFIDEIAGERGAIQRRAGFEQDAEISRRASSVMTAARSMRPRQVLARTISTPAFCSFARFGRVELCVREDDEVVVGGFYDAAAWRECGAWSRESHAGDGGGVRVRCDR